MTIVIVMGFESNGGGYATNTVGELGDHPTVKVLNNTTLASFDTLHLSSTADGLDNTHIGHAQAESWVNVHGWEIPVLNRNLYNLNNIVKLSQGGSVIAQWAEGQSYWTTAVARLNAALTLIPDARFYIFYTQGINDVIAGTSTAAWKAATKAHIIKMKTAYPAIAGVIMTKFESVTAYDMSDYDIAIDEIATEVSYVHSISSTGAGMESDNTHWNDAGINLTGDSLIDKMIQIETSLTPIVIRGRKAALI